MEAAATSEEARTLSFPAASAGTASAGTAPAETASAALRSLIVKTADTVNARVDSLTTVLESGYLAKSDFGQYAETIQTRIEQTARQTVESYDYTALIEAAQTRIGELSSHLTELQGRILRGVLTDPEGNLVFGLAIAENLRTTGETLTQNGRSYECIAPGQTLGLYTASGWQFWIRGVKCGWFDAADGMLHTANIAVESSLYLGEGWQLCAAGGFGLKYTGG